MKRGTQHGIFALATALGLVFFAVLILWNLPEWWFALIVYALATWCWLKNLRNLVCFFFGHDWAHARLAAACKDCGEIAISRRILND